MNVDSLNIEATPVNVSRRKVKSGLQGLKKDEQKKLTVLLLCFIGGGTTIGLVVFIWAIASGKFSSTKPEEPTKLPAALAQTADSGSKKTEKEADTGDKKTAKEKDIEGTRVSVKITVGKVEVTVLRPMRGAPPKGVKTNDAEVLIVPVKLNLKKGVKEPVKLTSWFDDSLQNKVSLKDDKNKTLEFFGQVADGDSDAKTITEDWLKVLLIFEAPSADAKWKLLRLRLPAAAFHVDGTMLGFEIAPSDLKPEKADKPDKPDKSDKSDKSDGGDVDEKATKSEKK